VIHGSGLIFYETFNQLRRSDICVAGNATKNKSAPEERPVSSKEQQVFTKIVVTSE